LGRERHEAGIMTLARIGTVACAFITLAGVAATIGFTIPASPSMPMSAAPAIAATPAALPARGPSPDSLATVATARHPFRLDRTAAPMPFDPLLSGDAPPSHPPRPTLTLVGIALGAESAALIDGLPGTEGTRVLRVGEAFAGYIVRRVEEDRVLIAGPDTTWTLVVRGARP
jgi:hypothetical protein